MEHIESSKLTERAQWERPLMTRLSVDGRTESGTTPLIAETIAMTGFGYNSLLS